ncbi:hypothetical protein CDAR_403911 [Caerostris darwini]|uniref:Uncharacterized protein n=1 Tax=Caerostris darwini TaxID=1538125 RepID=A0AAV4SR53_9ARAC|nr:hypothetical protein CDAR_403911 [Caerostris darwini]
MDRVMSFEEDLKRFVHMMAFFMGVKITMDCFDFGIFGGIFGGALILIIGVVINKVLDYDWNYFLAIWKRRMLKLWILTKTFIVIVIFTVIECLLLAMYASGLFGIIAMVLIAVELCKYVERQA